MNAILRMAARVAFYPTLGFSRAMERLGRWNRWDWVDDHVLLGAMPSRSDLSRLQAMGVGAVINLCREFRGHTDELAERGLEQLHLPTVDYHSPRPADVLVGIRFITAKVEAGGKVYVHCKAGRGRSATLVVCYLMSASGMSAQDAYSAVKSARPQVDRGLADRPVVRAVQDAIQSKASRR
ncbi:MAG: dual specificity protein phosphatase family protein [Phycisphaerae bacterium]